jgi:hypothetical protein
MSSPEQVRPPQHPWYEVVLDRTVDQGDLLDNCPVIVPKDYGALIEAVEQGTPDGDFRIESRGVLYDLIVLTQTCDFANKKAALKAVTCCVRYSWQVFRKENPEWAKADKRGNLASNKVHGLHVLQDWQDRGLAFQIVDLRETVSLPIEYARVLAARTTPHLRLKAPYREHLAQRFGLCFGRIGLDPDLEGF